MSQPPRTTIYFTTTAAYYNIAIPSPFPSPTTPPAPRTATSSPSTIWRGLSFVTLFISEPAHDKTYNNICLFRNEPDRPIRPLNMARLSFIHHWITGDVRRHIRSAKSLIRLRGCAGWSETSLVAQVLLYVLSCMGSLNFCYHSIQMHHIYRGTYTIYYIA